MVWIYTLISVSIVSLLSLLGAFTLSFGQKKLYKCLIYFVSLSAGTLMGDAFIHLIPEAYRKMESASVSIYILIGIFSFFVLEKFLHWRHCHEEPCEKHPHPFSYLILAGDSMHNFVDGMVIAASFVVSIPIGIATATAVAFHEIPHEIGNFTSLLYGGFPVRKALIYNFLSALVAILGAVAILLINTSIVSSQILIPFAAGGFIYIAGTDLIPELHKHKELKQAVFQTIAFILGIALMFAMLWLE